MEKRAGTLFLVMMIAVLNFSHPVFAEEAADKSLYERLGGEPAITAVVDEFVARAAANPDVNFTRQGQPRVWEATPENMAALKKHLVQFISVAAGATDTVYEGRDMKTSHEGMKITNAEFDALAGDLIAALDKFNVPEKEKNELLSIVGTTRAQIVEVEEEAAY